MKLHTLLLATLFLSSCASLTIPEGAGFLVTADSICISGMTGGDASEVCYNHKKQQAYIRYSNGTVERLKPVGGGLIAGKLVIQLEDGGRVSVGKDGKVFIEPPMPQK